MSKIVYDRPMMSLTAANQIQLVSSIPPGELKQGCLICFDAPKFCPCCMILPCCGLPEYIQKEVEASKYVYARENALEWNDPTITLKEGACFGVSLCICRVEDNTHVIFYDDPAFQKITDETPCCNDCRTFLCGGHGEVVTIKHTCCCGICLRCNGPCFVPICCGFLPNTKNHRIYVNDAQEAVYKIKAARNDARQRLGIED